MYHVREFDVHKLLQIEEKIDIFLSHDWPRGITNCGNVQQLLRKKPYFKAEVIICFEFISSVCLQFLIIYPQVSSLLYRGLLDLLKWWMIIFYVFDVFYVFG